MSPEAGAAFERAIALDPGDARARFYSGLAMLQRGEQQGALEAWAALIADAPGDAPWLPDLRRQAAALAEELGLDPAEALPAPRAATAAGPADGPTAEQMRAAEDMPAEEREEMIRGMVAGLAARLERQPDDLEAWRMLARSWGVLGEAEKSADAYAEVARRAPDDLGAQIDYVGALLALDAVEAPPSPELVAQLKKVLDARPEQSRGPVPSRPGGGSRGRRARGRPALAASPGPAAGELARAGGAGAAPAKPQIGGVSSLIQASPRRPVTVTRGPS